MKFFCMTILVSFVWSSIALGQAGKLDDSPLTKKELQKFSRLVGSAKIVGLGEQLHGSGGITAKKVEIIKHLVEKKKFRVIFFETVFGPAKAATNYVQTCEGSSVEALYSMKFRSYFDTTLIDLLDWLCEYNKSYPGDRVHFYGFDIQQPDYDGLVLKSILKKAYPGEFSSWSAKLDFCYGVRFRRDQLPPNFHLKCAEALVELEEKFASNRAHIVKVVGSEATKWAELSLISLKTYDEVTNHRANSNTRLAFEVRDRGNMRIIEELKNWKFPKAKTIVWADNTHIVQAHQTILPQTRYGFAGKSTGSLLHEKYGDDYFTLAIIAHDLRTRTSDIWRPGKQLPLSTDADVITVRLKATGKSRLFVSTSNANYFVPGVSYRIEQTHEWANFNYPLERSYVPSEQYDAFLFLDAARENDLP